MKIKSSLFFILLSVLFSSCASLKMHHYHQKQYFPKQIHRLFLGMPFHKFEKIKNIQEMEINSNFDFRTEYTEFFSEGDVEEITYYFTMENPELFEFIIKFKPDFGLFKYCHETYGAPNAEDEWIFDSHAGFDIMIWTFETKLVIAGTIVGSGWE